MILTAIHYYLEKRQIPNTLHRLEQQDWYIWIQRGPKVFHLELEQEDLIITIYKPIKILRKEVVPIPPDLLDGWLPTNIWQQINLADPNSIQQLLDYIRPKRCRRKMSISRTGRI